FDGLQISREYSPVFLFSPVYTVQQFENMFILTVYKFQENIHQYFCSPRSIRFNSLKICFVTRKVKIAPHDYSKDNLLATFTPQKQLTPEQIFWSNDLMKIKSEALKERTKVSRPIKAFMVYPPNTPAALVPKVLPTKSQVKILIFTLIQLFSEFDQTCRKRITPSAITDGERGFEQTKACYLQEVIPFFKTLKDNFKGIQKALTKEVKEMKDVFEELEAEATQYAVDRKHNAIKLKNLLIANDNLIAESRFIDMHVANTTAETRCLALEAELANLLFVIGKMQASLQGKDNVIRQLKKELSQLQVTCRDTDHALRVQTTESQISKLTDQITRAKHIEQMTKVTTENMNLKTDVSKATVNPLVSARDKHTIDVKPIVPRLRNNWNAYLDYLRHLKESVETIRDIVEEAKVVKPLDRSIVSACRYTKHSQELLEYAIGTCPHGSQPHKMADVNIPSDQTPTMAPPVRADDQILPHLRPRAPVLQILWGIVTRSNIDYVERIWEEFTQSIHTFIEDKRNLSRHTLGKKRATLIVILSIRFTKLINHHLQRKHRFHPRPGSLLHLSNEEPVHGYLKFSTKGTKREIFGMPIPSKLITTNIREAPYYQEYQENVAKHRVFLAGETRSTQDLPAPKLAKPARKPQSTAQKAPLKHSISSQVTSTQPAPTSVPAKTQENKRKQATGTTYKPAKAKRIKHEDADFQKAVEESMKDAYALPKGLLPPVVIREPESGKYQPLLEVPGKGKAKVSEDEEESKKIMLGVEKGSLDKGQAGPDPNAQAESQTRSDTGAQAEGQAGSSPDETSEGQAGLNPDET
nr:retrovirus-related Pol polyprotein from transposon TNT 1-94 [Tanacetum cinerariifolium]